LTVNEQAVLRRALEASSSPQARDLAAQIPAVRVVVGPSTFLDLEADRSARRASFDQRRSSLKARSVSPDATLEGFVVVWVDDGYLSGLEFGWVTDDVPTGMPSAENVGPSVPGS
jgi:hypothetical protein